MYDFWQDNYEWLLSGIIPTLITAIFGIIKMSIYNRLLLNIL